LDVREEMTGMDRETAHKILLEDLKKKKVCACFVPPLLMSDRKLHHAILSVEFVEMSDDDRNVLKRIVIGNERWCFMYDPDTKRQRVQLGRVQRNR
jgi:hypothetical protein